MCMINTFLTLMYGKPKPFKENKMEVIIPSIHLKYKHISNILKFRNIIKCVSMLKNKYDYS